MPSQTRLGCPPSDCSTSISANGQQFWASPSPDFVAHNGTPTAWLHETCSPVGACQ